MDKRDRVEVRGIVTVVAMVWVLVGCLILIGGKCTGGSLKCQKLPDGTISCEIEGHRH